MKLTQLIEQKERPYVVFHTKKGKYETHAVSSYDAAKNAAKHWGLKSTADITSKLADVEHVAETKENYDNRQNMEYAVFVGSKVNENYLPYDEAVRLYDKYKAQGYDDVQLDARIKESYSPGDEYADSEGMVSNCCGAPMMDYNDGFGRCGDCKEMASGETEEEYYESVNEDEEAIAARDEFMKVMDMKPTSSHKAIDTIKQIVADKQNMQVKFDDGKMKVDLYTASAVSQVYDAVNDANKEKIDNMLRTKEGMLRMSNFAFSKLSEQMEIIREAEKEGRLDEVLPLAPLALGALRVVGGKLARKYGPKVASAIAKKFPGAGKAVGDVAAKAGGKAIRTPGASKWANTKAVGNAVKSKSPYLKTAAGASAIDYATGGDGTGVDTYNRVTNKNSNSSGSSSKSNGPMGNYANSVKRAWESKEGDENILEYTGKDAVLDKNGKPHDPRSSKGKMIINMKKKKKNGPEVLDKDKKRRNMALLKKGTALVKDTGSKIGKAAASSVAATGFNNPFEGIEDKAAKMIEDAVEKTEKMPKIDATKIKTPTNIKVKGPIKTGNYDDRIQRLARGNKPPKKSEPKDSLGPLDFKAKVEF